MLAGGSLTRDDAAALVAHQDLHDVLYWAHCVREARFGDDVKFCSIGAGKVGACSEDCKWCAQSSRYATHIPAEVERTSAEGLHKACVEAFAAGASSFGVVNSGRAPSEADLATVTEVAASIAADGGAMACASLGELDAATAERLVAAGVRRYNHNLETSRRFYGEMVTTHAYDCRLATLTTARQAGLSLCCGGIFGLGETWADRIDLAMTLRDQVAPDVTPLNFLHPIPGTPLADAAPLTGMECLRIIAVFRLLLPRVDLKIAGGRQVNLGDLQSWIFYAGATSCLVGNYLTTIGRDVDADRRMVADLGLRLVDRFSFEPDP